MTQLSDWNLELAHINWDSPGASNSVQESLAQAYDWIARWQEEGSSYVACILVDDKESPVTARSVWLDRASDHHPELFELLDFVCFESDLITLKDEFLAHFAPPPRGRIDRELERYREKHGKVACSHDIAIWHLLRLGGLASGIDLMIPLRPTDKSPFALRLLSVLEEEDREAESRAREILRYSSDLVTDRIYLEFYA